jgi:hypothetical protein
MELDSVAHYQKSLDAILQRGICVPFPETSTLPAGVREVKTHLLARVWRVQKFKYKGLLIVGNVSLKADQPLLEVFGDNGTDGIACHCTGAI